MWNSGTGKSEFKFVGKLCLDSIPEDKPQFRLTLEIRDENVVRLLPFNQ